MRHLAAVSLLGGLLGDAQHSGDLLPRGAVRSRACYGVGQRGVGGFADHAQQLDELKRGLVERCADRGGVFGDHVALVEEWFVCVGHASRLVDAQQARQEVLADLFGGAA